MVCDIEHRKPVCAHYGRTLVTLFCLLVSSVESSSVSGKAAVNTVELLTAFSGEREPGLGIEVDWDRLATADFYLKSVAGIEGDSQ